MSDRAEFYHQPVLFREVIHAMRPLEGRQVFDGTLGGGGHSEIFLKHGAHVIGCDQDEDALSYASDRLSQYGDRFLPLKGNFEDIDQLLVDLGIEQVDGILLDLGVSSHQLDEAERGFSFRRDGPLDMRMDRSADGSSAADLVNHESVEDLTRIFREFGEERAASKVALAIEKRRAEKPFERTVDLADLVASVVGRVSGRHPATRVFQGLRIAVNRELEVLESVLEKSLAALAPDGVLAVITFHSLEDRIVKRFMRQRSAPFLDRPEWPEPRPNPDYAVRLPSRKAISAQEDELKANPRSRSAKLRVAIRV
ncbi:MAG: 16S rRNA (cytosine(1402)-N(4))-methyltransferase RsmH [Verrucomicrobiota bacterium]